jgi:hypothetical protein
MRTIETNCFRGPVNKRKLHLHSLLTTLLLVFFSGNLLAQTISFPTSCTSKDLTLLKASLPAPAGNRCACSGDRILVLGIHNGTSSTRTSFALWGTLIRKDAAGAVTSSKSIFACAGPIPKSGDYYLNATTVIIDGVNVTAVSGGYPLIHVDCGESLDIIDMHLAWTSANSNETCDVLYKNPGTINPKCGTQDLIRVDLGVNGDLTPSDFKCSDGGGKIRVTPFGGLSPYEVSLDSGPFQAVPANTGYYDFTAVAAGPHSVSIRDNTSRPVAERCSTSKSTTVVAPSTVTANAGTDFIKSCSTNANGKQIGEGSTIGYTYSWSPATGLSDAGISNPTANPTSTTTYTVTKTETSSGCSNTDDVLVTVNKPTVTANAGTDFIKSCSTNANGKQIGEASTIGYTYSWSPATGLSDAGISNPTANPTSTTTYTVTKTETSSGCFATDDIIVTVNVASPTFTVCLVQPTLCAGASSSGQVTVNASNGTNFSYKLNSGSPQSSNVFSGLGAGSVTSITVFNTDNSCSTTVNCGALVISCGGPITQRESVVQLAIPEPTVKAYPNPFNDHVKFVINSPAAGNGSLEVYNVMGQRVKTVYQGRINAGNQSYELVIPKKQQETLIYILRVDGKKVTGKLLQLNN